MAFAFDPDRINPLVMSLDRFVKTPVVPDLLLSIVATICPALSLAVGGET